MKVVQVLAALVLLVSTVLVVLARPAQLREMHPRGNKDWGLDARTRAQTSRNPSLASQVRSAAPGDARISVARPEHARTVHAKGQPDA